MTANIGFIGLGNMGGAMARGLTHVQVHGVDLNQTLLATLHEECGLTAHKSMAELAAVCDYLVLAIKPQHAKSICQELAPVLSSTHCLFSICAGLSTQKLRSWIQNACPIVRVMPNTPALVNQGVFALCLEDQALTESQKNFASTVFQNLGQVHILPEKDFDAFTSVIGSGPAYVCYFIEALIEAAVQFGLAREQATEMVYGLFQGTTTMCQSSDTHVSKLREMVTSPAGTTIEALVHLDRKAIRAGIIDAARKSYMRSKELGS